MTSPLRSMRDCAGFALSALLAFASVAAGAQSTPTMPFSAPVPAGTNVNQDAQDVTRLLRAGRLDAASAKVDAMLTRNPDNAQARFLKGLVLSDQGRIDDAITRFRALSEDYPELPEPYNNLAALHATKGEFDLARLALEAAVRANPGYVTAHENLGDLYTRMASQAYDKVLQLDKTNVATRAKLATLRNAMGAGAKPDAGAAAGTAAAASPPVPGSTSAPAPPAGAPAGAPARAPAATLPGP